MLISEFYKDKELFITGGTGYLGKSFIEKLLRDCPDVAKIYILIREKRNKTPWERLKDLSNDLVFDRLHREQPKAFEKIFPIVGDCSKLGLGISSEDLALLKNVNIIVHGAANVRFDTTWSSSILMNTRGTHELLKLALNMKHLIAFLHISTAYVNPFQSYVKEEMCEAPVSWRTAIKIAETVDDETLESLQMKYVTFPNNYTFTKNLSEQVVYDFADRLPITILRPAIVSHAVNDPEPGFLDNLNGPMAALIAVGMGLGQVIICKKDLMMSIIPVDTNSVLTIIAGYRRGLETINSRKMGMSPNGLDVRNLTLGKLFDMNLYQSAEIFLRHVQENPFKQTLWAPRNYMTDNFYLFLISIVLINIPMAIIYDALLMLAKKKTMVMKLTRKYFATSTITIKYSTTYFDFQNDGMFELFNLVPEAERDKYIVDFEAVDKDAVMKTLIVGVKKYILKEPIKASPSTKRRYKILVAADKILTFILFCMAIMWLWKLVN